MVNNRKEITRILSKTLEMYISPRNDPRIYYAKEVTFDFGTSKQIRVDFMKFKPVDNSADGIEKGDFYCYEVKSCAEDFNSKNGHNFIGNYNYYVMNKETYELVKHRIGKGIGVLVKDGDYLKSVKRSARKVRDKPLCEMLLMMYRSNQRDKFNVDEEYSNAKEN